MEVITAVISTGRAAAAAGLAAGDALGRPIVRRLAHHFKTNLIDLLFALYSSRCR